MEGVWGKGRCEVGLICSYRALLVFAGRVGGERYAWRCRRWYASLEAGKMMSRRAIHPVSHRACLGPSPTAYEVNSRADLTSCCRHTPSP